MNKIIHFFAAIAFFSFLLTSCDKDNEPILEQELITTVELRITLLGPIDTSHIYYYRDLDGDGGNPPIADKVNLNTGQAYALQIRFLDESNPGNPIDLTNEIENESGAHLVCYQSVDNALPIAITDNDLNGNPLGLHGEFNPTWEGSIGLIISLKHEPDKSDTDPCSTGDTDVDVTFNVTVQ